MSEKVKVKAKTDFWAGKKLIKEDAVFETDPTTAKELIASGTAEAVVTKEKATTE